MLFSYLVTNFLPLLIQAIGVNSSPCHDFVFKNVNDADKVNNGDKMSSCGVCILVWGWVVNLLFRLS